MAEVECFFDCSSPWTYFAFESLLRMQEEIGVTIQWRPFLVGGVFNAVNPSVYNSRERRCRPSRLTARRISRTGRVTSGLPIIYRPSVFPVNSVKAMRACIVLEPEDKLVPFARETFKSYWIDDQDISQVPVLKEICDKLDIDSGKLLAGIDSSQ